MTTLTPPRHVPDPHQRTMALELANRTRIARSQLKREIRALPQAEALALVTDVVAHPRPEMERMKVRDLLLAAPKWHEMRADRALRRAQISPFKCISELTSRQRSALGEQLDGSVS